MQGSGRSQQHSRPGRARRAPAGGSSPRYRATRRARGYSRTAAGTSALPRTGRSTPSAPLRGKHTGYTGPAPPRSHNRPGPTPQPGQAHAAGPAGRPPPPPVPPGPGHSPAPVGMRGTAWTHCSTRSREPQPRRCRRPSWSDAPPPAPRWSPPSWSGGGRGGPAPAVRTAAPPARPPPPARNGGRGGSGADPGGRGGRIPPAVPLVPAARRVGLAGCGGFFRAGEPGNAGLLLPSPHGAPRGVSAVLLQPVLVTCCFPPPRRPVSSPVLVQARRRTIPATSLLGVTA